MYRSASTISRERGLCGYPLSQAQRLSETRRRESHKACKITDEVREWIETLIRQELSPQQVVDYLKRHKRLFLHHETVYGLVYEDKAASGDLYNHLRVASKPYRKRYGHYDRRGKIKSGVDIDERLTIVESRHRIGDWEGDTVMGKGL
ncbi:MAG: IS30 family transposase [Candidatus Thiodiazotropha sp. (ex Lucinoma aequizonata)]|nr:IS30 family transposase [Candidatus Thiodiazotropha sp. (ex Lucinoma aequizonata)]MCU7913214.1 IS30 family transposase [Candidatus Thiodiazotropha sp. (ex Lucinoma aequizonata)]